MPDDRLAAELAVITARGYRRDQSGAAAFRQSDDAARDVPRLVKALEAALKLIDGARSALSAFPSDCTNVCYDDACNCSGVGRPLAWDLDPTALRETITSALTGTETAGHD